jgi:hypothetical protein
MIKRVLVHQEQAKIERENGITVYPSEEILGSMKSVQDFAAFYITHKIDLEIIKAHYLLQYCENMLFNPQELNAYKMGLDAVFKLFESADSDVESYMLEAKQRDNRKTVG